MESLSIVHWTFKSVSNWAGSAIEPEAIGQKLCLSGFNIEHVCCVSMPAPRISAKPTSRPFHDSLIRIVHAEWFSFCGGDSGKIYECTGESMLDVFSQLLILEAVEGEKAKILKNRLSQILHYIHFIEMLSSFKPYSNKSKSYDIARIAIYYIWEFVISSVFLAKRYEHRIRRTSYEKLWTHNVKNGVWTFGHGSQKHSRRG
jgi:hypothetical protein